MIEMHFWEQLTAIAECGTISAAAEKLHLTQPALSRSMKKMEQLLGVSLFEHGKNKIALSETGKLAAKYAGRLLEQEKDIVESIRSYDQARHTIKIGACAPVPLRELVPRMTNLHPGKAISSEINDEDTLIRQISEGILQIAVLRHPISDKDLCCEKFMEEKMFFAVTKLNPLAKRKSISLTDINGQTILLYSQIGFWYELCKEKLPQSRLLLQNEFDVFSELTRASEFPYFISDWHLQHSTPPQNRIYLPIEDEDFNITYYSLQRKGKHNYLKGSK